MMIVRRDLLSAGAALLGGAALGLLALQGPANAHEYDRGKLKIEHPWVRAPKDGQTTAYFYAFIHNSGDAPDKLIAIKSPNVGKVEFHADEKHGVAPGGIAIPAGKQTTLAPDGPHAVLSDVKKFLQPGWGFELVLVFEKAGEVTIDAAIDAPDAQHAHDAEALERWEKAHAAAGGAAPAPAAGGHDHHEHHHHHDAPAASDHQPK